MACGCASKRARHGSSGKARAERRQHMQCDLGAGQSAMYKQTCILTCTYLHLCIQIHTCIHHAYIYIYAGCYRQSRNAYIHAPNAYIHKLTYRSTYTYIYTHTYIHIHICRKLQAEAERMECPCFFFAMQTGFVKKYGARSLMS